MKISLLTPEQTRRHQANTSTSKFACSFSKQKRFSTINPEYFPSLCRCKQAFYLKDKSELSKMTCRIPLSHRSDFTKTLTCSPSSTKYGHKSFFKENIKKGKSFGLSRESSPDRSYLIPQVQQFPGPGKVFHSLPQYNPVKKGKSASSYSLRSKLVDFDGDRLSYKKAPGPGAYQEYNLSPKYGKINLSKFNNPRLTKIRTTTKRFLEEKYGPGPSDYVRKDEFSKTGSYMLSKDIGQGRRPFDQSKKIDFTQKFRKLSTTQPGPFEYEKPSDFGQYGDSKYYKTLTLKSVNSSTIS